MEFLVVAVEEAECLSLPLVVLGEQAEMESSGCGFTNERHNKKESSWCQRTGWASYAL